MSEAESGRRGSHYASALLAPTFLAGVLMTLGGFIWWDAGQATEMKNMLDRQTEFHSEYVKDRADDSNAIRTQLDEIKHGIDSRRDSDENDRRHNQDQYNELNAALNKLTGQFAYMLGPKPDDRR